MDSWSNKNSTKATGAAKLLTTYDRSRISLYLQVASVLRERVHSGVWSPGNKIATLEELEREFHVARVTVRQAVEVLREEGLLQTRQGRGTYVAATPRERHFFKLATDWKTFIGTLKDNVPRRFSVEKSKSKPQLAAGEGIAAESYVKLESIQYRDDDPYSSVNILLASHVFEQSPTRFKNTAALVAIDELDKLNAIVLRDAYQTLTVGSADPVIADALKVPLGSPTVNTHFVVVDNNGIAIYVGDIVYRSDSIQMRINLLAGSRPPKSSKGISAKRRVAEA